MNNLIIDVDGDGAICVRFPGFRTTHKKFVSAVNYATKYLKDNKQENTGIVITPAAIQKSE